MNEVKNKCRYFSYYGWECPYEALEDSKDGFCIFHEKRKNKDIKKFNDGIKKILEDKDTDAYHFEGFFFPIAMNFADQKFKKNTYFTMAEFIGGDTTFQWAEFSGRETYFNGVKFKGESVNFFKAKFAGENTYFTGTEFKGKTIKFTGTTFEAFNTDFSNTEFEAENTFFVGAKFLGNAVNFYDSRFIKTVWFDRTIFDAKTCFTNIDLSRCVLLNVDLRNVDLNRLSWDWDYKIGNETELEKVQGMLKLRRQELYFRTSEIYQQLKVHFYNKRDFAKVGLFHFREQECKRRACELPRDFFKWVLLWILKLSCGYGEKLMNVVLTSLALIFLFALGYMFVGLYNTDNGLVFNYDLGFTNITPIFTTLKDFGTSLVFSAKGFFPLWRFQQYKVVGNCANTIAGLEVLLGAFMVGLFIYVFRRRMDK